MHFLNGFTKNMANLAVFRRAIIASSIGRTFISEDFTLLCVLLKHFFSSEFSVFFYSGIIENGSSTMTAGGGATTIVDQGTKMKQLQLRNLKRLREKVKEEEEKLRALKSAAAKIKESSSSSSNAGGGGAGGVGSSSIGENDEDYDADCSAMESTPLKNKLMSNHNNNTTTQ